MKKEKKKSVLTRIIPYAGKRKYMLFLAMAFSALSGILLLMPMWYIHNIIKNVILNGNVNYTMIRENIAYAVIFPCVGLGLYVLAGIFSHLFAFEVEENIIKISVKKLLDKPLGYFMNKESGKLRGIIINGAGETHNVLAHQLPDIASTFVSPFLFLKNPILLNSGFAYVSRPITMTTVRIPSITASGICVGANTPRNLTADAPTPPASDG